jgi:methionyl-tRNA synthetase
MPRAHTFVSTTIPYVNARPHLGHALEFVQADCIARYFRARGDEVWLSTGSDENSLKNVLAAEALGIQTAQLVADNAGAFSDMGDLLGMQTSIFLRTSVDPRHEAGALEFWRRMVAQDDIYSREYEGLYCVGCEQFYTEDELADGVCSEHFTAPDLVQEANYFFRLSRYQQRLHEAIESGALTVVPETRQNEVLRFIESGLQDISISRSATRARGWGIEVPGDPTQVMYVWIDALTNYVNGLGFASGDQQYTESWVDATRRIHVVGKGVTRFHAVYWPAMLMAAGLPLPTHVVVHGYITQGGRKLSKNSGNVIDPAELVEHYGVDPTRYVLLADLSTFGDGDLSTTRLVARNNADLANGLGNLVSRCTSMVDRYFGGITPPVRAAPGDAEAALAAAVATATQLACENLENFDLRAALTEIWELVRHTNGYVSDQAPWQLAKAGDLDGLATVLHHLVASVRHLGALVAPFIPASSVEILKSLHSVGHDPHGTNWLAEVDGLKVVKPRPLFPRLEEV